MANQPLLASALSKDAVGHLSGFRMLPKHKHHAASPDDPDDVLRHVQMFCLGAVNAHHLVLDLQEGRRDGCTGAGSWYASKEMDRLGGGLERTLVALREYGPSQGCDCEGECIVMGERQKRGPAEQARTVAEAPVRTILVA